MGTRTQRILGQKTWSTLVRLPESAASGWVYFLAAVAVLFLFAALHALYACVRLKRWSSSAYLFAMVVLATTALVTRDQVVLHNVTKDQAAVLAQADDRSEEELKSALGVVAGSHRGRYLQCKMLGLPCV
jgi:hypothetical protein